jgi:hypothetical protein
MIKVVKLVTGEDVVADIEIVDESSGKVVVLKRPQRFMVTSEGVGSIPLVPFSNDEKYTISMNHVVLIAEPDADIKNGYNGQFGTGIVVPGNNKFQV